ncbi:RluA family pseudouridine synthase [Candidatus Omnitrophota bacterium]
MSYLVLKVDSEHQHKRLDVFLAQNLPDNPSRTYVKKLIDHGHVKVCEVVVKPHHKLALNDEVQVDIPEDFLKPQYIKPEDIPLDIFYQDPYFLIINKPSGLLVHPAQGCYSGTLVNALMNLSVELSQVGDDMRPGIVHRLDRETSGLIIIAKDNITHTKFAKQFQRREVHKRYVALVAGRVEFDEGEINEPLGKHVSAFGKRGVRYDKGGKESVTRYRVLKRFERATLIALYPKTGRTHQLRVHMRHIGHAILGDDKYGKKNSFPRLALHAQSIGFMHPQTKQYIQFSCRIPPEFRLDA